MEHVQRIALESWLSLTPRPQIILVTDHPTTENVAKEYGVESTPCLAFSPRGVPLLSSIFEQAYRLAKYDLLVYVNADIIVSNRVHSVVEIVSKRWKKYLIVSSPYLIDHKRLSPGRDFEQAIKNAILGRHYHCNIDIFIFQRSLFQRVPPFAVGKHFWDSWLVSYSMLRGIPVIDATDYLPIFHPNEEPYHLRLSKIYQTNSVIEAYEADVRENRRLAGQWIEGSRYSLPYYIDEHGNLRSRLRGGLWPLQVKYWLKYILHTYVAKGEGPLREKLNPFRRKKRS
ncbi:MAG: hypothetical protein ABDH91_08255 [Bacteroidia bacterium]